MVVLTALVGALHAAILIPFKLLVIIPGVTEIRPANAIPIACSILFGPAAAWGAAIGNTIGDMAFGFGPGTFFGMVGNFLYGFAPYALWRAVFGSTVPDAKKPSHWVMLVFVTLVASSVCAWTIGWGIDVVIKGVPFGILTTIILINNFLIAVILAPPLLFALLPRVKAWGLLYTTVLPEEVARRPRFAWLGAILFTVGSLGGLVAGESIAWGFHRDPLSFSMFMNQVKSIVAPAPKGGEASSRTSPAPKGVEVSSASPRAGETSSKTQPTLKTKAPDAPVVVKGAKKVTSVAVASKGTVPAPAGKQVAPRRSVGTAGMGWGLVPFMILLLLGMLLL